MICPKCGGEQVAVEMVHVGGRTARHGVGFGGRVNNTARAFTAVSTLGMSNVIWKKSEGTQKEKIKNQKMALCQTCGHDWKIK